MKKGIIIAAAGIVFLVLLGIFFNAQKSRATKNSPQRNDNLYTVRRMDLHEKIDATGTVSTSYKRDIIAEYDAVVKEIRVKAGDIVKQGELLMTLTSSSAKSLWNEANSALKQAETNLATAQTELARLEELLLIQGAAGQEVEAARAKVDINKEQLNLARAKVEDLKAKNGCVYLDKDHETVLIRAPFSGVVAWVNVGRGEAVLSSAVLMTVMAENALEIMAEIDENDISQVDKGQRVIIAGKDPGQTTSFGLVSEVGMVGTAVNGIVTFPVRIKVMGAPKDLKVGMTVDITIVIGEYKNVLAVPAGSVINRDGRDFVTAKKGDKTVFIPVKLGFKQGRFWEIKEGLKEGEVITVQRMAPAQNTRNNNNSFRGPGPRVFIRR